jgi:hypothetical protein
MTADVSHRGLPLAADDREYLERLSLAEPRLKAGDIHRMMNARTGMARDFMTIKAWVDKIRDRADLEFSGDRDADGLAVKAKINEELRESIAANARRILRLERDRAQWSRFDRLSPAEASRLVLREWKRRFGPQTPKDTRRQSFHNGAYTIHNLSRRMERARHVTCTRRHAPYGMETAAG